MRKQICVKLGWRISVLAVVLMGVGCTELCQQAKKRAEMTEKKYAAQRAEMVRLQLKARGVKNERVLEAMGRVERHRFVPGRYRVESYIDSPLSIGKDQTISQPYIVAYMTELLELKDENRVLEIGTGSGYQAAILAELCQEVYTIEIIESLGFAAEQLLGELNYENIKVKVGDGYQGWPEHAPFDAIIVTAAPDHVPQPLIDQLAEGGRLIIPVGDFNQELILITREQGKLKRERKLPVRFVPMTGKARDDK